MFLSVVRRGVVLGALVVVGGCALTQDRDPSEVEVGARIDGTTQIAPANDAKPLEEEWGPGELAALLTGTVSSKNRNLALNIPTASWYVREQHRKGMGLLGGALAYDMVSTQWSKGRPVGRKLTSFGLLGIAGRTDERRWDGEGYHKSHWFFPFYRYHNRNGQRIVYPLFLFPIALRRDENPPALAAAPWQQDRGYDLDPPDASPLPETPLLSIPGPPSRGARLTTPAPQDPLPRTSLPRDLPSVSADNSVAGEWQATTGNRSYRVRKGDTLFGIARREYGHGRNWRKIFDANRETLSDPHRIQAGMTLTLP